MSGITARSDQQPVPLLVTVTLTYSVMEDRVRLDGIDSEGETLTLWLTARLLSRLIPYLQQQQPEKRSMHQVSPRSVAAASQKTDAVQCSAGSPEVLVVSVDVRSRTGSICLSFKDIDHYQRATFVLSAETFDCWSSGLKQCFKRAGWPQDVFERYSTIAEEAAITVH